MTNHHWQINRNESKHAQERQHPIVIAIFNSVSTAVSLASHETSHIEISRGFIVGIAAIIPANTRPCTILRRASPCISPDFSRYAEILLLSVPEEDQAARLQAPHSGFLKGWA